MVPKIALRADLSKILIIIYHRKNESLMQLLKTSEKSSKKFKDKLGTNFFQRNLTRPFLQKQKTTSAKSKRNSGSLKKDSDMCLSLQSKIMGKIISAGNTISNQGHFTDRESIQKKGKKTNINLAELKKQFCSTTDRAFNTKTNSTANKQSLSKLNTNFTSTINTKTNTHNRNPSGNSLKKKSIHMITNSGVNFYNSKTQNNLHATNTSTDAKHTNKYVNLNSYHN